MGIGIQVDGLTKWFGPQRIREAVTFDFSAGEVSVMLGPSGTGKSVFYGAIRRADRRGSLSGHVQAKIDKLLRHAEVLSK